MQSSNKLNIPIKKIFYLVYLKDSGQYSSITSHYKIFDRGGEVRLILKTQSAVSY